MTTQDLHEEEAMATQDLHEAQSMHPTTTPASEARIEPIDQFQGLPLDRNLYRPERLGSVLRTIDAAMSFETSMYVSCLILTVPARYMTPGEQYGCDTILLFMDRFNGWTVRYQKKYNPEQPKARIQYLWHRLPDKENGFCYRLMLIMNPEAYANQGPVVKADNVDYRVRNCWREVLHCSQPEADKLVAFHCMADCVGHDREALIHVFRLASALCRESDVDHGVGADRFFSSL
ncbi:MAG TPA: inovirus-type Gp2 protein [Pseudomonadales bacterium]|nr:inovirus-type Gp2 protein [Pseudomonadales bacterium]